MKIYLKNLWNSTSAILALTLLLCSCSKSIIDVNPAPLPTAVSFIQASPDEPPVDFYLGNSRFAASSFNYAQYTGYVAINSGNYQISFLSDIDGKIILSDSLNFKAENNYSLFLANKPSQAEVVLLTDTLNKPTAGNATVRFINLSPDAPAVDLVEKGGSVIAANRAYKGYSSFLPVTGNLVYTFEVHRAGTSTVLATLNNITLQANYVYTVWFHGLAASSSSADQLSVDILTNGNF